MASVNGSDASARATPKLDCTAESTTGTDHMPTVAIAPIATEAASRTQAYEDSTSLAVLAWSIFLKAFGGGGWTRSFGSSPRTNLAAEPAEVNS
jgi:hypothetical protein